ncbi:tRNA-dependent cyclodipeptide synthase [Nocardia terpenica]|uniref:Cyclodipeptide synthase n=1 Tax=Nocardia terpenica TaxID=455432 RepID=A0A6G9ZDZ0_9NOCA|nr:tRNA-dependent cyclodipeptide synthase [Nocardia terpenica]QIS23621.1 tRNA-dependent cyclodipeptide synthase [Nocardia terpenica]
MLIDSDIDIDIATRQFSEGYGFSASAVTPTCWNVVQKREHVLIGLSPNNSYFSAARILRLAHWACASFASMHFLVLKEPYVRSLEAVGYSPARARAKAHKALAAVETRARRALESAGIEDPDSRILTWQKLQTNSRYLQLRQDTYERFVIDEQLADACLGEARRYLYSHAQQLAGNASMDTRSRLAVTYYLNEVPLFVDTASIVGTGSSAYCYHKMSEFHHNLYARKLSLQPSPHQARIVLMDSDSQ